MWKLYRIIYPNGKCYIGITRKTLLERFNQHKYSKYPVGNAIRKYGAENVNITCLLEDSDEELIKFAEEIIVDSVWVSSNNNYNLALGGSMPPGVSMKGCENPVWKGGVTLTPCKNCGKPTRGLICWDCRLLKNSKTKTLCVVCSKPTSRPEYKVHRSCRNLILPKCPICNKPTRTKSGVHIKCSKKT